VTLPAAPAPVLSMPPVLAQPAQPKYIVVDNAYWQRRDSWCAKFAPSLRAIKRAVPKLKTHLAIAQAKQLFEITEEDRAMCTRAKNSEDALRLEASIAWVMAMLRVAVDRIDARELQPATPPASPPVTVAMPPPPPSLYAAATSVSDIAR
jgi:hypothetical protein